MSHISIIKPFFVFSISIIIEKYGGVMLISSIMGKRDYSAKFFIIKMGI